MGRPAGFFDVEERLAGLSKKGDDLERLAGRGRLRAVPARARARRAAGRPVEGRRPPFDHVLMFKVLILQTQNNLSDERTEFYLRDRLTWMRFLGLGLGDPVPDANTIWTFREALTKAGAIEAPVHPVRPAAPRPGLPRDVGATGRREPRRRAQAAQHPGREAGDQGGPGAGGLAGPAGEAQAEGPRCALDRQDDQGQAARGRDAAGRPGDPRVRLPEPHQRRSPPPADPPLAGHRRRRACRGPSGRSARPRQYRRRGLGRHRLPFQEERGRCSPSGCS